MPVVRFAEFTPSQPFRGRHTTMRITKTTKAKLYRVAATVGSVVVASAALGAPWKW